MGTDAATWVVENGRAVWSGHSLTFWSERLVAELVTAFAPTEIWLFGSVSRGDDDGDSDLDILVVLDQYDPSETMVLKGQAFEAATVPAPFDVAFTDAERMRSRGAIAGTIERAVRLEGRRMYLRD